MLYEISRNEEAFGVEDGNEGRMRGDKAEWLDEYVRNFLFPFFRC